MPHVQFGVCVPIFAYPGVQLFRTPNYTALDARTTMQSARRADELGYDSLWVADHLMLGKDDTILEGWTVIAALAGATEHTKLGMIHQAMLFRHPSIAAKMAATLDQISGGRLIHFVDTGSQRRENLAYGFEWSDDIDERNARLVETLELTLKLWSADQPVDHHGRFYQVDGAICLPPPLQQPHPPIWLGETHPATLAACARYAQGWNTVPVTLAQLQERMGLLAVACEAASRPFDEIEKSLEIQVLIAPDRAGLRQQLQQIVDRAPDGQTPDAELAAFLSGASEQLPQYMAETWLAGTPDEVAQRVQAYIDAGISHFMLWFADAPEQNGMQLFAEQVTPRFRTKQ